MERTFSCTLGKHFVVNRILIDNFVTDRKTVVMDRKKFDMGRKKVVMGRENVVTGRKKVVKDGKKLSWVYVKN